MLFVVVQEDRDNNSRADVAFAQESSGAVVGEDANGDADVLFQVLHFGVMVCCLRSCAPLKAVPRS